MKNFLALAILSVSSLAFVPSIEAKTGSSTAAATAAAPQIVIGNQNRRYQRRARVVTQPRNVRRGRALYRETYQTTYRPNGRVVTRLISRVVIRRY